MRTAIAVLLAAALPAAAFVEIGKPSPPFSILRPGAAPLALESYKGKVVLLMLVDTNCTHCQDLTRQLKPLAAEYAARGVQFLECAFNDTAQAGLAGFIRSFQPDWPMGYAPRAAVDAYLGRSVIDTTPLWVPHLVLLDRTGIIRGDYAGDSAFLKQPLQNLKVEFDKLLASPAAKKQTPAAKKAPAGKKTK